MAKAVLFDQEARDKMMKGFDTVSKAIMGTLSPKGANVYIDQPMTPEITNDGATIAQHIELEDKVENMGANIVRNTSSQTNDDAGDGTTTTVVLLHSLVHECIKRFDNPMDIRESVKEASIKVLESLKKQSVSITKKDIERVALISAEDKKLTKIITDIFHKLGNNATVSIEDSRTFDTEVEIIDGYEANVGFLSDAFVTDLKKANCIITDAPVLVTEKKISTIQDIVRLQEQLKTKNITNLVIVCEDIDDAILGIYTQSKRVGLYNGVVIRATGDLLKDIEAATGATRISNSTGVNFQNIDIAKHLGRIKKVTVTAHKTIFIPENPGLTTKYANILQSFANSEHNQFVKERLERRVSQLKGSVAILKIGAATDFERVYLKRKAEDAVKAVKAALAEGIVEGGGMALWRIGQAMKAKSVGEQILKKVLCSPLKTIAANSGKDYAEVIKNLPDGQGYDAKNDKYVNMIESGIIDPTKVERCALENAVSAATTFITAFCTISDAPIKTEN